MLAFDRLLSAAYNVTTFPEKPDKIGKLTNCPDMQRSRRIPCRKAAAETYGYIPMMSQIYSGAVRLNTSVAKRMAGAVNSN